MTPTAIVCFLRRLRIRQRPNIVTVTSKRKKHGLELAHDVDPRLSVLVIVRLCLLNIVLLCVGCGGQPSEYERGYAQGVGEVRNLRQEKGWEGEMGLQMMASFSYLPVHKDMSADWNAGYQKGIIDEIHRAELP